MMKDLLHLPSQIHKLDFRTEEEQTLDIATRLKIKTLKLYCLEAIRVGIILFLSLFDEKIFNIKIYVCI